MLSPRGNDIKHVCHPPIFCRVCFALCLWLYYIL
nr:MAG TPA: hypothetical protein [Caudoviricetes sp.]